MSKFNLSKKAAKTGFKNYNKMLEDQTKDFGHDITIVNKNFNLSLNTKDKDNTIPYEKQIEANREGRDSLKITEKNLNTSKKLYVDKRLDQARKDIMPINLVAEAHDQKHLEAYKNMSDKDKRDTLFWDKYVGAQILNDEKTTVDINVPKSQLENHADRFKNLSKPEDIKGISESEISKLAMSSLQDADALLFHIYASAASEERGLTKEEKKIINDISVTKNLILGQAIKNKYKIDDEEIRRLLGIEPKKEHIEVVEGLPKDPFVSQDEVKIKDIGGEGVVFHQGKEIDRFPTVHEARVNYPEGKIV